MVGSQSQRLSKLDGDDWGELCDKERRVEADEVTGRVDTCTRRSARLSSTTFSSSPFPLAILPVHIKYCELFYIKPTEVIITLLFVANSTPTDQTIWTFHRYLGLDTCSSALSPKGDTLG